MNMQALLKQAQKMQKEISETEKRIQENEYTSSIGGGAIKVKVKGNMRVESIDIETTLLQEENKEDLQEMLKSAINEALTNAETEKENQLKAVTGGIKLPGGF